MGLVQASEPIVETFDPTVESPTPPPTLYPTSSSLLSVSGSTDGAPFPTSNPVCGESFCANGCPSRTYTVVGTGERMVASTCSSATVFDTQIYVYEGTECGALTCLGECSAGDAHSIPSCCQSRYRSACCALTQIFVASFCSFQRRRYRPRVR